MHQGWRTSCRDALYSGTAGPGSSLWVPAQPPPQLGTNLPTRPPFPWSQQSGGWMVAKNFPSWYFLQPDQDLATWPAETLSPVP